MDEGFLSFPHLQGFIALDTNHGRW